MNFDEILEELKLKVNSNLKSYKYFKKSNEQFLNIRNQDLKYFAKKYFCNLTLNDVRELLNSKFHEIKLFAVFVLVKKYELSESFSTKKEIVDFYLKNSNLFSNWDLVDQSAYNILGNFLIEAKYSNNKIVEMLKKQIGKKDIWSKRIVIVSMYAFIKKSKLKISLEIMSYLISCREDLIQKAIGWMLREIGKKNKNLLKSFLTRNIKVISRISLRYAIERFDKKEREFFLKL